MITALPSGVQVRPRTRGPWGNSINNVYGCFWFGSTSQTLVGRFACCSITARRRPSGDQAAEPGRQIFALDQLHHERADLRLP